MEDQLSLFNMARPEKFGLESNWLIDKMQKPGGCSCPLCHSHVQLYKRCITGAMAKGLILIYKYFQKHPNTETIQIEGYLKRLNIGSTIRGDIPKLRYWGFIGKQEKKRKDGSQRNGHYFLTEFGKEFVLRKWMVRQYVLIYNNKAWGTGGKKVTIQDCLGKKFDYDELMNGEID